MKFVTGPVNTLYLEKRIVNGTNFLVWFKRRCDYYVLLIRARKISVSHDQHHYTSKSTNLLSK
jgi:hypothetical protein